jgi:glycosyltransferase involved in cell wall biosynthesis
VSGPSVNEASRSPAAPPRSGHPEIPLVHVINAPFALHFVAGQVGFMSERRFAISVITSPGEQLDAFGRREGVEVYGLEMPRRITPLRDIATLWRMYLRFKRIRPVIVHAHTPKGGLLGMICAWLARVPVRIYHIRALPFVTATGPQRVLLRSTERVACALAHQVLCVSHSLREVVVEEGICSAAKIQVLLGGSGNGVDAAGRFDPARWTRSHDEVRDRYAIPRDAVVIGFIGRLVRDKGVVQLVEAWKVLREEHPELHLLVVGGFEPRDPVPAPARAVLCSDPRVHMAGWATDTAPYYAASDLVVLPSHREGLSNVLLEASAMSLPVVATRIPGCLDVVEDGATGTLYPVCDVAALTDAIRRYVRDAERRRRHGRAGREKVLREFRREAIWQALHAEYQRLLREKGCVTLVDSGPPAETDNPGASEPAAAT